MAKKLSKKNAKARRELKERLEREATKLCLGEDWDLAEVKQCYVSHIGNFTVVEVEAGGLQCTSVAKYNPNDEKLGYPYSEERGLQIALGRACADIARQMYP